MDFIDEQLIQFKMFIEKAILTEGMKGKEHVIRSSLLINLIHDAVKYEFIQHRIAKENVYPSIGQTKPELKLTGLLKQKDQDICIIPGTISPCRTTITWGPMKFQCKKDPYGPEFTRRTLVINIRSQMSSLAKNADTLFERTFAEALNLHLLYPDIVLGEVYLIPVHEYDDDAVKKKASFL